MTKKTPLSSTTTIRGKRLNLVPFGDQHITPEYLSWLSNDEVNRYSRRLGLPPQTRRDVDEWLAGLGVDEKVYAIDTHALGLIGTIKYGPVRKSNRSADLAIMIGAVGSWGRGYGAEATYLLTKFLLFERGLNRLHAASINPAYVRMVENLGWQREGVLREETVVNGRSYDSVLLSFLKREFRPLHQYEPESE